MINVYIFNLLEIKKKKKNVLIVEFLDITKNF